jgi:hypothetical protein
MAAGVGVAAGCIDDLPPPAACPPAARQAVGDCLTPLEDIEELGCLTPAQTECFTGPRPSCTCVSGECPTAPDACFPDGDCPTKIGETVGPGAACSRLASADFGKGLPSEYQCLCGCGGCAAVCDGAGPVFGITTDGNLGYGIPTVDIAGRMPSSGRLGIYLRVRGLSQTVLLMFKGADGEEVQLDTYYYVTIQVSTEFTELVFFDQDFLNLSAYAWQSEEEKPTLLAFFSDGQPEAPSVTLMEIDCVVPFVLP